MYNELNEDLREDELVEEELADDGYEYDEEDDEAYIELNDAVMEKVEKIMREFNKPEYKDMINGVDLTEDLIDLLSSYPAVAKELEDIKYSKIVFFGSEETDSVGFTLNETQIEFTVEVGEDEEGPWFEVSADIITFGGEE